MPIESGRILSAAEVVNIAVRHAANGPVMAVLPVPVAPKAVCLTCGDSRIVAPAYQLLGLEPGECFDIRTAGASLTEVAMALITIATDYKSAKAIFIIRHSDCLAEAAHDDTTHVVHAECCGLHLARNFSREKVIDRLREMDPTGAAGVVAKMIEDGDIALVFGFLDLEAGKVTYNN